MNTSICISSFILIFALFTNVQSTVVKQCADNSPLPEVEIQNCDQAPCVFYINATASMTMKFTSPRKLEHIAPHAVASLLGLIITYPLDQDDACDGIDNTNCPIAEGQLVDYSYDMFVSPLFPIVNLTLEFSLVDLDQQSDHFECFSVDLQLENQS